MHTTTLLQISFNLFLRYVVLPTFACFDRLTEISDTRQLLHVPKSAQQHAKSSTARLNVDRTPNLLPQRRSQHLHTTSNNGPRNQERCKVCPLLKFDFGSKCQRQGSGVPMCRLEHPAANLGLPGQPDDARAAQRAPPSIHLRSLRSALLLIHCHASSGSTDRPVTFLICLMPAAALPVLVLTPAAPAWPLPGPPAVPQWWCVHPHRAAVR